MQGPDDPAYASRPGVGGRHRTATRLPGVVGLASLVGVLLVTLGVGALLLPPSFARGAGDPGAESGAAGVLAGVDQQGQPGLRAQPGATPGPTPTGRPTATPKPTPTRRPTRTTPSKPESEPTTPRGGTAAREDRVTALVNARRREAGCGGVRTDERLRRAARGHSQDMADRDYFSHDSLDGRSPWDRAKAAGYARPIGENIAKGQRTPEEVVQAWMDSPGHRRNILNCDARAIGVGLASDGGTPIWTQLFGAE